MELLDRSLVDVLAVVGEEVGLALEAQEDGNGGSSSGPGGDAEVMDLSETMVAAWRVSCRM
jgi:hypothetical protein